MIDEKTAHLKLPLPHPDNLLEDDVKRLRQALAGVDAKSEETDGIVATLGATLETVRQSAAEAAGKAAWAGVSGKPAVFPPTGHHAAHEPGGSDAMTRFSGTIAETFQNLGTVSGAKAINLSAGNVILATIGGATTFSFTGLVAGKANTVLLKLTNAGSAAITWPAAVKWAGGSAPVLSAAGLDVVALETDDDGASWIGILSGMDMQ